MKIYIVTSGAYSDYQICAVFLSEEKAKLFCAANNDPTGDAWDDCDIEEFETSDDEIDGDLRGMSYQYSYEIVVSVNSDNTLQRKMVPDRQAVWAEGTKSYIKMNKYIIVSLQEADDRLADKIAADMFAQWKAEKYGIA